MEAIGQGDVHQRRVGGEHRPVLAEDAALKVTDLAIGGEEVMRILAIGPGPRVGEILDALLERVLDDPSLTQPKKLKSLVESIDL